MTWKESLWPSVCQKLGVEGSQDTSVMREYALTVENDIPPERIFSGEPHRLGTYENQKP